MLQVTLSSEAVVLGRRVFEVELGRRTAVVGIVEEPGPLCLPLTQPPVSSFLSPFLLTPPTGAESTFSAPHGFVLAF